MPNPNSAGSDTFSRGRFHRFAHDLSAANFSPNLRGLLGSALLVTGLVFLLDNLGIFQYLDLIRLWPVILVVFGLLLLIRHG